MTQAKSQSEAPQASFSLKDPLTWGVLGAFALSSFLSVSLLTQLSRGTQAEGARTSTQLVLGLGGAFGTWPLLLCSLGVVAGSGLLFVQPRRLRGLPAALAILGALLTLSFAVGALSPGGGGAVSGWLAGAGVFGRLAAFAVASVLGLGTVLAGFEALGLDSTGIRGSLGRLTAVGNLGALGSAIASRSKRATKESSPTATGQLPLDEHTEDPHAVQPARRSRPSQPKSAAVPEPAGEQPAGQDLAGAADKLEDRDVVRPLSRRPGSVAAQPARTSVDVPQPTSPGASESGEPKPHVADGSGESGLDELVVRHLSPAGTEKRPVIEPDLGETHEPRAMSTNAVEAASSRTATPTEDPAPGPMAPIATEDPQPLFVEEQASGSAAAVAEPPRVSSNAQRVEESESEWAEVEALIATPTAELVEEPESAAATEVPEAGAENATATAPEVEEAPAETDADDEEEWEEEDESAELEDEEWEESDEDDSEEDVEEGAWDEAQDAEEGDEEEWEEGDEEEEGEWDSAEEDDGEWEESEEEEEWEEEPATAEASVEAEEDSDEEWEEEDGEEEEWDESAEWEEGEEEEDAEAETEEPAVAELEEAPEAESATPEPVASDVTTAESLTQNDLFGEAAEEPAAADPDPAPAPQAAEEAPEAEVAEAASEPIVELQPAAPDRERLIQEVGLMFIRAERVAVSMLQRTYDLDFDESTAILDELQQRGLIGPYMGGKQRDILMDEAAWAEVAAG